MSPESGKIFTFTWKIANYSMCYLKNAGRLESPVISTESFNDTKWYMSLYPNGASKESSGFISCFLYRNKECKEGKKDWPTSCSLEMLDPNGKVLASMEKTSLDSRGRGLYKFIDVKQLTNIMDKWKKDILEIRCQLFDINYKEQPILCEAHTEIQMNKYLFDWRIILPEFRDWTKQIKCQIEKKNPIDISVITTGDKIILKIRNPNDQPTSELWKLKISIINHEGTDVGLEKSTYTFDINEFVTSFERKKLNDKSLFALDHSFKLTCVVYISDGTLKPISVSTSYENLPCESFPQLEIPRSSLQRDLKHMLLNKEHCDLKLHAENEIVPVHKCILTARSPVFSAMFKQEMMENQTGSVNIPDVESDVLHSFVEFLYTDAVSNTDLDHVLKLMLVADKYQVCVLKEGCSQILMSKLSVKNVSAVISVANLVNHINLKQFALNYIRTNKMVILLSEEWSEWVGKNMKLAIEILTKMSID